jgi:hypothetical protein
MFLGYGDWWVYRRAVVAMIIAGPYHLFTHL